MRSCTLISWPNVRRARWTSGSLHTGRPRAPGWQVAVQPRCSWATGRGPAASTRIAGSCPTMVLMGRPHLTVLGGQRAGARDRESGIEPGEYQARTPPGGGAAAPPPSSWVRAPAGQVWPYQSSICTASAVVGRNPTPPPLMPHFAPPLIPRGGSFTRPWRQERFPGGATMLCISHRVPA